MKIVLSCEHATNAVPSAFAGLFSSQKAQEALQSHEGWDPGSRELAALFLQFAPDGLLAGRITRLLLELNRSPENPARWSRFTETLDEPARARLDAEYFVPHQETLLRSIAGLIAREGSALHLSVHSFTRVFRGHRRAVDIGILFDPAREEEARLAQTWITNLRGAFPDLRVEGNEPYRGTDDGLTTLLRKKFPPAAYSGIELEVCADLIPDLLASPTSTEHLVRSLTTAIG